MKEGFQSEVAVVGNHKSGAELSFREDVEEIWFRDSRVLM